MTQVQIDNFQTYAPSLREVANGKAFHDAQRTHLETSLGSLSLYTSPSAEEISHLSFDPQFGEHSGLGSHLEKRETLLRRAAEEESFVALAVSREKEIIGFCTVASPQPDRRWAGLNSKAVMSVEVIEVARDWRGMGVGRELLRAALGHSRVEEKIIYMEGYTWTWDLEGTNMAASQYREMMKCLFESFQFTERRTNELNISLDENNLFMCRVGKHVGQRLREDFKWLLIGIRPH